MDGVVNGFVRRVVGFVLNMNLGVARRSVSGLLSIVFLLCCCSSPPLQQVSALPSIHTDVDRRVLVDEYGRYRIFRGINFINKVDPYFPELLLNQSVVEFYRSLGMNTIRLGCLWGGVEPIENQQDDKYIENIRNIVQSLASHEIYTILDAHQDVAGPPASYPGIPKWAMDKSHPQHAYPWPWKEPKWSYWGAGYFTQQVSVAFQDLYKNNNDIRDAFIRFWKRVAKEFRNEDGVLGYEILNEPWPGDIWSDPTLMIPGIAGSKNLLGFYDAVSAGIREVDGDHLIFFEPVTWGMIFNGQVLGSGFDRVPGGELYRNMSVFSYHYYCSFINMNGSEPYPSLMKFECDSLMGPLVFSSVLNTIKTDLKGTSAFMTEWGTCGADGDDTDINTEECQAMLDMADQHLQSWTFWDNSYVTPGPGQFKLLAGHQLGRPYARATAGTPSLMRFNSSSGSFDFSFTPDLSITQPTEIVLPKHVYPNGYMVSSSYHGLQWKQSSTEDNILLLTFDSSTVNVEDDIDVTVQIVRVQSVDSVERF